MQYIIIYTLKLYYFYTYHIKYENAYLLNYTFLFIPSIINYENTHFTPLNYITLTLIPLKYENTSLHH